ncbi:sulfatase-like hydrolase/transferase [Muricauda sp. CAU 1633]|uniref:sulfatase-like hydrolase/transferase n=1 Tax=Allomuricauda sp. CAU 1633 TaxID=2816036 RepID=UPI001A8ED6E6|nr:sulfatase-like hydrolase/transferase [Muricauda sp. CAU 1633]MBO0323681.1 sulfatase-like hydrolase/transferase [Muricauda sp. CAU 1633]
MKSACFQILFILFLIGTSLKAQERPNIVLIFPDNLGMGEVGAYGGVRGVPTPNIDRIGEEGIRLTNFNVEYTCVPSRIAILTGRYATRTGENYFKGIPLWEKTIAEGLKSVGYATGLFGKYDVGGPNWQGVREPMHQGFDEWYGIPGTSHVAQFSSMEGFDENTHPVPYIWEGKIGSPSKKVKPFNLENRRTIDREAAERSIAFMQKNVQEGKPFFVYYPMTQLHFPTLPHPDKIGETGAGDMGDSMADVDYNVGLILSELKRLGIEDNTLVIWCTDNGAEMRRPWRGNPGSWRGFYNSAMEGGVRTPCVIRWPGRIKPGQVSNDLVHQVDLFATLAAAANAPEIVPKDRAMDGVDQLPFFEGKHKNSNRESVLFMNGFGNVMAVKWHDWKLWYNFKTEIPDPNPDNLVRLFDLQVDPREETDMKDYYPWVIGIMDSIVKDYEDSLVKYPRVPESANEAEPYTPAPVGSGKPVEIYTRTDRGGIGERSPAMENPDFSGTWSTTVLHTVSVINRVDTPKVPDLGSGWGDQISIQQTPNQLNVERVVFIPREIQPLVKYQYALDGSKTENKVNIGRFNIVPTSTAAWKGNKLEIVTIHPFKNPKNGNWLEGKITQTLWLEPPTQTPWEPRLIVETTREGVLGGLTTTNRSIYTKGYR